MTTQTGTSEVADLWTDQGYIVVRYIYDPDRVAELKPVCEDILDQWRVNNPE